MQFFFMCTKFFLIVRFHQQPELQDGSRIPRTWGRLLVSEASEKEDRPLPSQCTFLLSCQVIQPSWATGTAVIRLTMQE